MGLFSAYYYLPIDNCPEFTVGKLYAISNYDYDCVTDWITVGSDTGKRITMLRADFVDASNDEEIEDRKNTIRDEKISRILD